MGYHKLCHKLKNVTSTEYEEICPGGMFGGGNLVGSGTNAVSCNVWTGPTRDGPWEKTYSVHTQYSGIMQLGKFYSDRWLKVTVTGTGATFDGFIWFN